VCGVSINAVKQMQLATVLKIKPQMYGHPQCLGVAKGDIYSNQS